MAEIEGYDMPDGLYYHKEHAWVKVQDDGLVKVGMNDFYQKSAGDTTYVDLPFEDDEVEQGETCGKIQSAKWVGKFVSPLTGEVANINEELEDDCSLINTDPYGGGWIMIIRPSKLDEELKGLFHGDAVADWIKKEKEEADSKK